MKNQSLLATLFVVGAGAVIAWFGFGEKLGLKGEDKTVQSQSQTAPAGLASVPDKAKEPAKTSAPAKTETSPAADKKAEETASQSAEDKTTPEVADKAETQQSEDKAESTAKKSSDEMAAKPEAASTKTAESKESAKAEDASDSKEAPVSEKADETVTGSVPSFDVVRVDPDGNTVVAGKAEPGALVELMDGTSVIAKAQADETGAWVMVLEEALKKGAHDLSLAAKAKEGAAAVLSKSNIAVAIPEEGGELLVIESQPGEASKVLANISKQADNTKKAAQQAAEANQEAEAKAKAELELALKAAAEAEKAKLEEQAKLEKAAQEEAEKQKEAAALAEKAAMEAAEAKKKAEEAAMAANKAAMATELAIKAIELEGDVLFVAGDAKPAGSKVRLYVDNRPLSDSESGDGGNFLFDGPIKLEIGSHDVRVDLIDAASGEVLKRAQVTFEKKAKPVESAASEGTTTPASSQEEGKAPASDGNASDQASSQTTIASQASGSKKVIIRRGDNLWEIARRVYGAGYRYSTIYDNNTGQIRDPHWIYPGQVFDLPDGEEGWEQNFDAVEAPSAGES
ncbi:MAG: LysM peptidoglycan-binding domain-containing protein [Cohaesibacter sp.]|jgi:nucleoid-associated protein YgaU|nr:LysM peptidoglycan-binding domain-containing protein [Cohaesibacter sp.]